MTIGSNVFSADKAAFLRNGPDKAPGYPCGHIGPCALPATLPTHALHSGPNLEINAEVTKKLNEWDRFCVLAFQIDPPAADRMTESLDSTIMQLIMNANTAHGAVGARCKPGLYCCAVAGSDTDQARKLALAFQTGLAKDRLETVSVGIAPYPLLDYDRRQCIDNSVKALDHAAFLGFGSTVVLDAVTLNISGDKYYQSGELGLCMAEYRAALALDPDNTNVLNSLGVCLAKIDNLAEAKTTFETVIDKDPAEAMAVYNLGMVCLLENRPRAALTYFNRALELNGDSFEILWQTGKLRSDHGQWEKALGVLEKAAGLRNDHWPLLSLQGKCLAALGETDAAIRVYSQAVRINPHSGEIVSALGCLYDRREENPDICEIFLQQGISLDPENGLLHHRLGRWYQKHNQLDRAMAAFARAATLGHDSSRRIAELQDALPTASDMQHQSMSR